MDYIIFLGICLATTFSPGPAVVLAIKNSTSYGVPKALVAIMGNLSAMMTLATLSAIGLGAVILASETLFMTIKIIGGLYLIYLGVKAWNSRAQMGSGDKAAPHALTKSNAKLWLEAYTVGVSNPKAVAFYTALFPQFINLDQAVLPQFILLALTFALCSFSALCFYALAAQGVRKHLMKENVLRTFHRVTGGVFVGFGISLILSSKA
ncbi:LysE family translocator [Nitrincola sp. MINF-07-Sa-05]|uniref:LysE family translocator n=1 Tax=Nitrincola salilacus TaxID=3400273 RepID=UPI003917DC3F